MTDFLDTPTSTLTVPGRCLVLEDDAAINRLVSAHLAHAGWKVVSAGRLDEARALIASEPPFRLIVMDVMLPDGTGFDLLRSLGRGAAAPSVIVMTADATHDHAVAAVRCGASDFLLKPFSLHALDAAVARVRTMRKLSLAPPPMAPTSTGEAFRTRYAPDVIGSAPSLLRVFTIIERIADTDCSVLITGDSGTGKELIARAVHDASDRAKQPFMAVNCAAIPEHLLESELFGHTRGAFTGAAGPRVGRFAAADGGTIFLDEIGEMPLGLQAKILRLLQEKEVTPLGESKSRKIDVRVVAATNQDLEEMVRARTFREDLLYRLQVIPIELPALRHRREDIPQLVRHFLLRANTRRGRSVTGLDPRVLEAMVRYDWPGNIRQLENVIERMVLLKGHGELTLDDLPEKVRDQPPPATEPAALPGGLPEDGIDLRRAVEQFEASFIREALARSGGNRNRAAALLRMNRTTLVEKLKRLESAGAVLDEPDV